MPEVSGVVLAGGASQRLGAEKCMLLFCGRPLLHRTLTRLAAVSNDLLVVGGRLARSNGLHARLIDDVRPGLGPLGGIYSGLKAMSHDRGLCVACDMPFLNLSLLRYMTLISNGFDVVIPRVGDRTEPLHAVYSKACLGPIAGQLERGEHRVVGFFQEVRVRYVEACELDAFDPQRLSFFNINSPSDLELARRLNEPSARRRLVDKGPSSRQ